MKIVLDSNTIIANFWMQSTNFKILFENVTNGNIEIYIPEIVLDEVKNKYQQRLNKSKKDIESELKKFNSLSRKRIDSVLKEEIVSNSIDEYAEHLEKVINENRIKILPYPSTDHKIIAKKAMLKLKPFNVNEKGYRDCLIWENIKGLLTEEEIVIALPELVFITNNYKDFSEKDSYELHPNLISELIDSEFASNSVVVYPSLIEYNDKQGKLFFEQATTFEKKLREGEFWDFDLVKITSDYLFEKFVGSELHMHDINMFDESNEPTVRSIDEEYEIKISSVKKLSSKEYLIDVEFEVESEVDFFIDKHDYYSSEDSDISIEDPNWNRHVMWASTMVKIPLSMTVIVDNDLNVISSQINKVNENYAQQYA